MTARFPKQVSVVSTLVGPSRKRGLRDGSKIVVANFHFTGSGTDLAIYKMGSASASTGKPAASRYIFAGIGKEAC